MKTMRVRRWILVVCCLLLFGSMGNALAADSTVTYNSNADKFVFVPNTDLFQNFKGIMPGDTLKQKITVKNDAANGVKVKIYLRAEATVEKYGSFLSQMQLSVAQEGQSNLFSAPENGQGGLSSGMYLGTFYSGADTSLIVTLKVPMELSNDYQSNTSVVNWIFTAEELPIESTDPIPKTGDASTPTLWLPLAGGLTAALIWVVFRARRKLSTI